MPVVTGRPGAPVGGGLVTEVELEASVTKHRPDPPRTVAYLGDSLMPASTFTEGASDQWAGMLHRLLGQKYDHGYLGGVSGETSDEVAARVSDVTDTTPAYCLVHAGANDIPDGVSSSTIITNLLSIVTDLRAAGVEPIVMTVIPSQYINTTAELAVAQRVNNWILDLPRDYGVRAVDWRAAVTDWAATTGAWPSGFSDGVHPDSPGCAQIALLLASKMGPLFDGLPSPMLCDASASGGLLTLNPGMTGSGGTAGTGASGTIPASWTVNNSTTGTVVCSTVTRTDGVGGNWLKLACSAGSVGMFQQNTAVGVDWSVGDTVWAETEVYIPDAVTKLRAVSVGVTFWNGIGSASDGTLSLGSAAEDDWLWPGRSTPIMLKTTPQAVPASTARLQITTTVLPVSGESLTGDIYFGRTSIRKAL